MIEHCLKPNPNAEKWKEVKDSLLQVRPEVGDIDPSYIGTVWREAKKRFKALMSIDKAHGMPLEVTEVIPEGLQGALSLASKPQQGLTPPGSPVQVNFYVGKDGDGGTSVQQGGTSTTHTPPNTASHMTSKTVAEQAKALRALAKETYKTCKTMIERGVTYLQLLAAVEMVVKSEGRGLVERVTGLIIDLQRAYLPASLIQVRLTGDFGTDFEDIVVAFGRLVDASGTMPKGWEKLKLPKNLSTEPAKGSETPSKDGTSSPQQVPLKPQESPQQATATAPQVPSSAPSMTNQAVADALQALLAALQQSPTASQMPQNATPATPTATTSASPWPPELHSFYETAWNMTVGCGKLSIFLPDVCEVCYSDVVGEGFEVEFSSLGSSLVAG